jgi:putative transposase
MTATLENVTKKKPEPTAEQVAAEELVRRAREQGLSMTGPDGLLRQLTKVVIETALDQERTAPGAREEHPGRQRGRERPQRDPARNGAD